VQEAVKQWLQERAEDMQANSQLQVQLDESAPPSIVEIINQAIEEAVRESQPATTTTNNSSSNNDDDDDSTGAGSPYITSKYPGVGAVDVPVDTTIKVYFDGTVTQGGNFGLIKLYVNSVGETESKKVIASIKDNCLLVDPEGYLLCETQYTLTIPAGAVQKLSGNGVNTAYEYSFTTSPWQMSDAPWTMYGHDPQRSGQSRYSGPDCPGIKWEECMEGRYVYGTPLVGPGGLIYMVDDSGELSVSEEVYEEGEYYLSLAQSFSGEGSSYSTPAIGKDGTVYYCAGETLYAVNADMEEAWSLDVGGNVSESSPVIGPDGTIYIVAEIYDDSENQYGYLLAVDPDNPEDPENPGNWRIKLGQGDIFSPAVGPDGTVYVAMAVWDSQSVPGQLFAVNNDGSSIWQDIDGNPVSVMLGNDEYFDTPVVGPDGTIYVVCDGILKAVSPQGEIEWTWDSEEYGEITGLPAVDGDGAVYLSVTNYEGMQFGYICKIVPGSEDDEVIIAAKDYTSFSTPAIGSDGTVYAASEGNLWAFDGQGADEQKWVIETISHNVLQPVIGDNDTIYLCSAEDGGTVMTAIWETPLSFEVYPDPQYGLYGDGSEPAVVTLTFNKDIKENTVIDDEITFNTLDGSVYDVVGAIYGDELVISIYGNFYEGSLSIPVGFVTNMSGTQIFEGCTIPFIPEC